MKHTLEELTLVQILNLKDSADATKYEIVPEAIIMQDKKSRSFQENADHYSMVALLICYIREVAVPSHTFTIKPALYRHKRCFYVSLNIESYDVSFMVTKPSLSFFFNICSNVLATDQDETRVSLDYLMLLTLINQHLSKIDHTSINLEIMAQAKNSLENVEIFLQHPRPKPSTNFMASEQNLVFGHEFHPTPKARYGLDRHSLFNISPELNSKFKLHYFKVPKSRLKCFADDHKIKKPDALIEKDDYILYPLHPWQAQYVLNKKYLCDYLSDMGIQSIGKMGNEFIPSASVRTLFQHENDYFYKFSLHLRLTNCLRKNAVYELRNAVQLNNIIKEEKLTQNHDRIDVLQEPLSYTLDLNSNDEKSVLIQEIFGLILRNNIKQKHQDNSYVALKLFSQQIDIPSQITLILNQVSIQDNLSYTKSALNWFTSYAEILFPFIFDSYLIHGVVFEPHLQNIIINLNKSQPNHIYIRDLEGTKLCLHHYHAGKFTDVDMKNENSIFYTSEQSFKRIVYCLIFNNFATAIHYIGDSDLTLDEMLWFKLRGIIECYKSKHLDNTFVQQHINQLLHSPSLPYKANLMTRFLKSADKNSRYTELPNPFHQPKVR